MSLESMKAKLLADSETAAEYESLKPEFEAAKDEICRAREEALENADYGLGDALEHSTAKDLERLAKECKDSFRGSVSAYKGGKIDYDQFKADTENTLHALIYQCYSSKVSQKVFDNVVEVLIEYLPSTVVLFGEEN